MRDQVLAALMEEGVFLSPEAIDFVMGQSDPLSFVRKAVEVMPQMPLVITIQDIRDAYCSSPVGGSCPPSSPTSPVRRGEVKVLKDITGNSTCEGNIIDFARYFNDRFQSIKRILVRRRELVGCVPISKAMQLEREVRCIGIVNDVRTTKNGHKMIELEDEEGKGLVLITKESPLLDEQVIHDEVIGVVGKVAKKGGMIVANEIIRPDIPIAGSMAPSDSSAQIAFLSDIHVGSITFLREKWGRWVKWAKTQAKKEGLEYILIPGDCVDGIGVYPDQEEELEIEDIFEQYRSLAELLKELPDHIQLIIQPGNHDAVRLAEPQPAFTDEISHLFDSSVLLVGNPCYLEVEGRVILSYHGKSMDDLVNAIQGLTYNHPLDAMREMLRRRHLAPIYGGKTAIAPEKKDHLVIDQVPDIFVTGHVHSAGVSDYRGVRLINASTWQDQTSFQRMHNFVPDPAKVPMVHLGTGKCSIKDFN
ncbi:MAG: DNA-directed DNA polymerase II small subunit [Methanomassiliicoccales archaeon]|nr:DNA-directed DNA polymerase II small subunit [Methanomassiliicoccales archaeon]